MTEKIFEKKFFCGRFSQFKKNEKKILKIFFSIFKIGSAKNFFLKIFPVINFQNTWKKRVKSTFNNRNFFATKFLIFELNYYLGHYSDNLTIQKKFSKFFLNLKFSEKFGIFLFA